MSADVACEEAQRAAVNGETLDAEYFEAVAGEKGLKRGNCEIKNVFVVDGVEFGVFDEIDGVRKFEDDAAFGLEKGFEAGDEVVGVWCVGEDVIAEDEVGFFARDGEFFGDVIAKEFDEGFDAFFARDFGDVSGGLDAEAGDFGFGEVLQEITVVAGDLDDVTLVIEREIANETFDGFAGVTKQGVRK